MFVASVSFGTIKVGASCHQCGVCGSIPAVRVGTRNVSVQVIRRMFIPGCYLAWRVGRAELSTGGGLGAIITDFGLPLNTDLKRLGNSASGISLSTASSNYVS